MLLVADELPLSPRDMRTLGAARITLARPVRKHWGRQTIIPLMIRQASLTEIRGLRAEFLRRSGCQVVRYSRLPRGYAIPFVAEVGGHLVAYGAVQTDDEARTLIEFFAEHDSIRNAERLVRDTGVQFIEAQTNMPETLALVDHFCSERTLGPLLFADDCDPGLQVEGALFRPRNGQEEIFPHGAEPEGDLVIEFAGKVVATGGFLTHYNPPYADLFMEVDPNFRLRGFGSFLIQELRRLCVKEGFIPAARCDPANEASARCLVRGGMARCGQIVTGKVREDPKVPERA